MAKHASRNDCQRGIALIIALFCLLLLSGVAGGLILNSSGEKMMSANYRAETASFYAAMSGLEEARGRFWSDNPSTFSTAIIPSTTMNVNQIVYILNPSTLTDTVAPTTTSNAYYDKWYYNESGVQASAVASSYVATATSISGCSNCSPALPGASFKWVRITANTEKMSGLDVDGDGVKDSTTPLFFDGNNQTKTAAGNKQVYRLTSLAVMPNGAKRLLVYEVAAQLIVPNFPAALTLDGPNSTFSSGSSANAYVDGNDGASSSVACPGAVPGPPVEAIGTVDATTITNASFKRPANITGGAGATPNIANESGALNHFHDDRYRRRRHGFRR